jgi:ketosteroid isomerase-like protein
MLLPINLAVIAASAGILFFSSSALRPCITMAFQQAPPSSELTTGTVVDRFNEAFNRHDVDGVAALLTEDTTFEGYASAPDGELVKGKAAMTEFWRGFFNRHPDARFETEEAIIHENRAIVRWVYRDKKNGQPWHLRGVDVFTVRGGQVAAKLSYAKTP